MIVTLLSSIIGALCVAAILAGIKSRWLYVIAPKLYLNTPISGNGQIISINIFNAGLMAEEDIALTFRQTCKFELIGTSKSTLNIHDKTISIPKLSKQESINIILLIEGKAFDPVDIESIESKLTKGKVVESKEKATALWQGFVIIPIIVVFLALPFIFGTYVGAEMKVSLIGYVNEKLELFGQSKQLAGYKTILREGRADKIFVDAIKNNKFSIEVKEIVRHGDILTITSMLLNNTQEAIIIEGYCKASVDDSRVLDYKDRQINRFGLGKNEHKIIQQKVFLPENTSVKIVENYLTVQNVSGESLSVYQTIIF